MAAVSRCRRTSPEGWPGLASHGDSTVIDGHGDGTDSMPAQASPAPGGADSRPWHRDDWLITRIRVPRQDEDVLLFSRFNKRGRPRDQFGEIRIVAIMKAQVYTTSEWQVLRVVCLLCAHTMHGRNICRWGKACDP